MQVEERLVTAHIAEHILESSLRRFHIALGIHEAERRRWQRIPVNRLSTRLTILVGGSLLVLRQTAIVLLLSDVAVNIDTLRSRASTFQLQIHQR